MPDKIITPASVHRPAAPASHTTRLNAAARLHHFTHRDPATGAIDQNVTVSVAVPTANTKSTPAHVAATPVLKDFGTPADVGDVPGRRIINLYFQDPGGNTVNDFDPPVELRVKITPDDRARQKGQAFRLVYWDGTKWTEIPDAWVVRHTNNQKFIEDPSVSAGGGEDIVVQLAYWPDDPAVGSGP